MIFALFLFFKKRNCENKQVTTKQEQANRTYSQCCSNEVSHCPLFWQRPRQVRRVRAGFKYALIGGCFHGEVVGKLSRKEAFYLIM